MKKHEENIADNDESSDITLKNLCIKLTQMVEDSYAEYKHYLLLI